MRRWLREPLVQFAAIGGALFAAYAVVGEAPPRARDQRAIAVDGDVADRARFVDDEVLYREALALGLHRRDPIVRRRLIQKMEFLLEGGAGAAPADAELQAWIDEHAGELAAPPTIDFEHEVASGGPFLLGRSFARKSRAQVAGTFGDGFADAVFALPVGTWSEPIASSYGTHRVRVTARRDGVVPDLDAVRGRVAAEVVAERRAAARNAGIAALRARYGVRGASPPPRPSPSRGEGGAARTDTVLPGTTP